MVWLVAALSAAAVLVSSPVDAASSTYDDEADMAAALSDSAVKVTEDLADLSTSTLLNPPIDLDGFTISSSGSNGTYGLPYLATSLDAWLYWNANAPAGPGVYVSVDHPFRATELVLDFDPETTGFGFNYVDWNDGSERSYLIVTTNLSTFELHGPISVAGAPPEFFGFSVPEGEEIQRVQWVSVPYIPEVIGIWNMQTWTPQQLDLEVSATSPVTVPPGGVGAVELSVINEGTAIGTGAIVSYSPPSGVSIDVASLSAGCVGGQAGPVACSIADVAVAATATLSIPITVPSTAIEGTTFTGGSLTVVADETDDVDDDGGLGSPPSVTVSAAESDLTTAVVDPGASVGVTPGTTAVLNLSVSNDGPSPAAAASLVVTLPSSVSLSDGTVPPDCAVGTPTVGSISCALGAIAADSAAEVQLPILVDAAAAPATVLGLGGSGAATSDSVDQDGDLTVVSVTTGARVSDLGVELANIGFVSAGEERSVPAAISNDGPSIAVGTTFVYTPPSGTSLARDQLSTGCIADVPQTDSLTCTLPDLAVGSQTSVTIPLVMGDSPPSSPATGTGSAEARSAGIDPDGGATTHVITTGDPDSIGVTVTGRVFLDGNRDGQAGTGEDDLTGVVVQLIGSGSDGVVDTTDDVVLQTVETMSPYIFAEVADGDYRVSVDRSTVPVGLYSTDDVNDAGFGSARLTVTGANISAQNLGHYYAAVSGVVRSPSGSPLTNVDIVLIDAVGRRFEAETDGTGSYTITGSADSPLTIGPASLSITSGAGPAVTQHVVITSGRQATVDIVAEIGPPVLAFTGDRSRMIVFLGLILCAIGFAMVLSGERRLN